jgi:hypothetical protein
MPVQKIKSGRIITVQAETYVGDKGVIFYDEDKAELRLSDGVTPGGLLFGGDGIKRATAAQWAAENPILEQGILGLEIDTGLFKFGNGQSYWLDLPYAVSSTLSGLSDVLAVNPGDGSVLVYDFNINKWIAQTNLDKQSIDAGFF